MNYLWENQIPFPTFAVQKRKAITNFVINIKGNGKS